MLYLFCQGGPWVVLSWPSGTGMGLHLPFPFRGYSSTDLKVHGGIHLFASLVAIRLEKRLKSGLWDSAHSSSLVVLISQVPTGISSGPQEWSSQSSTVLITSVCFKENRAYHCWITGSPTVSLQFWLECGNFLVLRK